jgi:hypothetical protein
LKSLSNISSADSPLNGLRTSMIFEAGPGVPNKITIEAEVNMILRLLSWTIKKGRENFRVF